MDLMASNVRDDWRVVWGRINGTGKSTGNIYQMWVAPEFRGKSIGKTLLEEAISWAVSKRISELVLHVATCNISALRMYENIGFLSFGRQEPLRQGSTIMVQPMKMNLV
jgi:ribosomal protein S18 acetylase RimI-like enzyme